MGVWVCGSGCQVGCVVGCMVVYMWWYMPVLVCYVSVLATFGGFGYMWWFWLKVAKTSLFDELCALEIILGIIYPLEMLFR